MALTLILSDTQATSDEFPARGGKYFASVAVSPHTGGTWTLQWQDPDGNWVTTGQTFTEAAIKSALGFEDGVKYRLHGGTVGAKGYISEFA